MTFCRVTLPLPLGAGAHGGTWHAVLKVDEPRFKRELAKVRSAVKEKTAHSVDFQRLATHGVRYSLTVSSWSNLRLDARLTQTSFKPGAKLRLDAALTEYRLPVAGRAQVMADIQRPDGVSLTVPLAEDAPGAFAAEVVATVNGVWRIHVRARGRTFRGIAFTREQLLSAAVMVGGDVSPQHPPAGEGSLACLLRCLGRDPGWQRWLKESGIDYERLRACLERCGKLEDSKELDRLG